MREIKFRGFLDKIFFRDKLKKKNDRLQREKDYITKRLNATLKQNELLINELVECLWKVIKLPDKRISITKYRKMVDALDRLENIDLVTPTKVIINVKQCYWRTDLSHREWFNLYKAGYILPKQKEYYKLNKSK